MKMILTFIRHHILPYWRTLIIICAPLLLLPLPILSIGYSTEKVYKYLFRSFDHQGPNIVRTSRFNCRMIDFYRACISKAALCGYVILLMAIYWMTEALPLPITSLIPVVLFPLFGILDTGKVCIAYMKVYKLIFNLVQH